MPSTLVGFERVLVTVTFAAVLDLRLDALVAATVVGFFFALVLFNTVFLVVTFFAAVFLVADLVRDLFFLTAISSSRN